MTTRRAASVAAVCLMALASQKLAAAESFGECVHRVMHDHVEHELEMSRPMIGSANPAVSSLDDVLNKRRRQENYCIALGECSGAKRDREGFGDFVDSCLTREATDGLVRMTECKRD